MSEKFSSGTINPKHTNKNHRGISLLSITGMILGRVLFNREQGLLPQRLCSFRADRGTTNMIFAACQLKEKFVTSTHRQLGSWKNLAAPTSLLQSSASSTTEGQPDSLKATIHLRTHCILFKYQRRETFSPLQNKTLIRFITNYLRKYIQVCQIGPLTTWNISVDILKQIHLVSLPFVRHIDCVFVSLKSAKCNDFFFTDNRIHLKYFGVSEKYVCISMFPPLIWKKNKRI